MCFMPVLPTVQRAAARALIHLLTFFFPHHCNTLQPHAFYFSIYILSALSQARLLYLAHYDVKNYKETETILVGPALALL